jgi:hypothetical protein
VRNGIYSFFFFWAVMGFELRASFLLGKRYTLSNFCFSYFLVRVFHFCMHWPWTLILLPLSSV